MQEEDFCRVCRNGSTEDNPLSYPCKCSGSIKYIHQGCLLEWIQHSKSSSCELCGHPFRFTPIYSENAPDVIPFYELIVEALIRFKWYIKKISRIIYIIFCWLFIVPTLTCWVFNLFFGQKWLLPPQFRNENNTLIDIFYHFFIGTTLFFWIILASIASYMIIDFIHHKHAEIEIQDEFEIDRDDTYLDSLNNTNTNTNTNNNNNNNNNITQNNNNGHTNNNSNNNINNNTNSNNISISREQVAILEENIDGSNNGSENSLDNSNTDTNNTSGVNNNNSINNNNNNNDNVVINNELRFQISEDIPNRLRQRLIQHQQQQQQHLEQLRLNEERATRLNNIDDNNNNNINNNNQPPPPQQQQPQDQQERVFFRIPGVFEMLRIQDGPEEHQNDIENEDPNQIDDLEHFIGLSGPLFNILAHCFILVVYNSIFLSTFLYFPYLIGQIFTEKIPVDIKQTLQIADGTISQGATSIIIGYSILSIISLCFLSLLIQQKISVKTTTLAHSFIKIAIITVCELGILPIIVGSFIDFCSLRIFGGCIETRIEFALKQKLTFLFSRWIFGIFFMVNFTNLCAIFHQIFRKGVIWFLKDPNDPDFDPFKDMIKLSFKRHILKVTVSLCAYTLIGFLFVYLPSLFLTLIPNFLPINIHMSDPITKGSADVLFIVAVSYFPRFDTKITVKNIVSFWITNASRILKLDSYLLPDPQEKLQQQQQQQQQNRNNNNNNDNNNQAAQQQQTSKSTPTTKVKKEIIKPNNFKTRLSLFIFLGWLTIFATICLYISLPVFIGRLTLQQLVTYENDIYSILVGLLISWIVSKGISFLFSPLNHVNVLQWTLVGLKILLLGIIMGIIMPLLTGYLFDFIFMVPIMAPYDETFFIHGGDIFQNWCLGSLLLKFWYKWITATNQPNNNRNNLLEDLDRPRDKWIDRFKQFKNNGFTNIDLKFTFSKIIFPICHFLLTILTVPICVSKGLIPFFGGSLLLESITFRYGFAFYCFILLFEKFIHKSKQWLVKFHNAIRDDKYLVGKHLHNLEDSNKSINVK